VFLQISRNPAHIETNRHEVQKRRLGGRDELLDNVAETLGEARQEIESHHDECAVWLIVHLGVGLRLLILGKCGVDDGQTPLENRLGVFGKRPRRSDSD